MNGKCLNGHVSTIKEWNEVTAKEFDLDINVMETIEVTAENSKTSSESVEYNTFVCPVCKVYHCYSEISQITEEQVNSSNTL